MSNMNIYTGNTVTAICIYVHGVRVANTCTCVYMYIQFVKVLCTMHIEIKTDIKESQQFDHIWSTLLPVLIEDFRGSGKAANF